MGLYFQEEFLYSAQMMSQITPLGKQKWQLKKKLRCFLFSFAWIRTYGGRIFENIFDICTFLWAPGAQCWCLHVFMSSRPSLMIFARFYELQALTDDIWTFLWASWEGLKALLGALIPFIKEPKTKNMAFWTKNLEFLSFYLDFFWNRDSQWEINQIGIRNQPMWIWNTVEIIFFLLIKVCLCCCI